MGRTLFCLLMFSASQSFAYPTPVDFDGMIQRWEISPDDPVVFYEVEGSDEDIASFEGIVDVAAEKWTEVETSYIELVKAEDGDGAHVTVKLKSAIAGSTFSSGFAVYDGKDEAGHLTHCTIEVHTAVGALSLAKTTLHELGHCVGLGHSLVSEAIMGYELEKNNFELDTDDIAGVSRLYPTDGSDPELPPGCSIGTSIDYRLTLLFFLLPLLLPLAICPGRLRPKGIS